MQVKLFIWLALIVILLLFFFSYYKRIILFLSQVIFGKYSFKFLCIYRYFKNTRPYPPSIYDELIHHIFLFKNKKNGTTNYYSYSNIQFKEASFNSSFKELIKKKGKPNYFNADIINNNSEVKIVGYKEKLFDTDIKAIYFFVDNLFFMGEYMFEDIKKINIENLSRNILNKYINSYQKNKNDFYIEGANNTMIYFGDNGFSLYIKFFHTENQIINSYLDKVNTIKNNSQIYKKEKIQEEVVLNYDLAL
ncbi:MAG: hypothetical protein K8R58_13340 [Bacteroidales bacterium]|nr:hypothetical protein [Bacteroidales bacterium]